MNTEHPITPPPELVQEWIKKYGNSEDPRWQSYETDIATQAARWGADQELEACCEWITERRLWKWASDDLRAARRPKPPSLKEQGMASLNEVIECLKALAPGAPADGPAIGNIRRALEALPDE